MWEALNEAGFFFWGGGLESESCEIDQSEEFLHHHVAYSEA